MTRPTCPAMDLLIGQEVPVADHGFVRLVDYMGVESSIVQAARVSYGEGTKSARSDKKLVEYLYRNNHTSPFEMLEIKLHVRLPIFVARQWVRHRTANINEYSGRYSVMSEDFYLPQEFKLQDTVNKQGSGEPLDPDDAEYVRMLFDQAISEAYWAYREAVDYGVSREQARMILPVCGYTEWYWKIDLRNLLHFLKLRCDHHAQAEIREYANAILQQYVRVWTPAVYEILVDEMH
jgi:thymidylate synthase (FAD)